MNRNIVPDDDDSTLFVCSGMQPVKHRFHRTDGGRHGSIQSCVRTDDIELVGDGSHLTCFQMVGNFSFGNNDYPLSVELWHSILLDLGITDTRVHFHPTQPSHRRLWEKLGYRTRPDQSCVWSDGQIGGYCCEVFVGDLEIGNLVHTLGTSTDVGFGWERLLQVVEGKSRVEQTSVFDHRLPPIVSDHGRTLSLMRENGIQPGNKYRGYVCRRLLRRMLPLIDRSMKFEFDDWIEGEIILREKSLQRGRRVWRRHSDKPTEFWWQTFGILPEEVDRLK